MEFVLFEDFVFEVSGLKTFELRKTKPIMVGKMRKIVIDFRVNIHQTLFAYKILSNSSAFL